MPSWWGKSSSKYVKRKTGKESFVDAIRRKFKIVSRDNTVGELGGSEKYSKDTLSDIGLAVPRSESPSLLASRCQSFNERPHAQPQPLPLPRMHHAHTEGDDSGITTSGLDKKDFSKPAPLSLLSRDNKPLSPDAWGEYATASVSSNSSTDTDDQLDSRLLSPLASDYGSGNVTAVNSPCRRVSLRRSCFLVVIAFAFLICFFVYPTHVSPALSLFFFFSWLGKHDGLIVLFLLQQKAQGPTENPKRPTEAC